MRSTAVLFTRLRINDSEGFSVGFAGEPPLQLVAQRGSAVASVPAGSFRRETEQNLSAR